MNPLMPSTIIHPGERLATHGAPIGAIPKMAPLMALQSDFPRKLLAADVAGEAQFPGPRMQSLENRRPIVVIRMIDPHVSLPVLFGGEAGKRKVAVQGTQERPFVAAVVGVAILFLVVALVKEPAQDALALEQIRAVVVAYCVVEPGLRVRFEAPLDGDPVLQQGLVELG